MDELGLGAPSEKLRKQLLEEELKLRKKQPPHWAKTKYRKYAMLYKNREKKDDSKETEEKAEKKPKAKPKKKAAVKKAKAKKKAKKK